MDVAREKRRHRVEHKSSMQRSDSIAGGPTDWEVCVRCTRKQRHRVEHKSSMQRSDSIVGGPADWEVCAR